MTARERQIAELKALPACPVCHRRSPIGEHDCDAPLRVGEVEAIRAVSDMERSMAALGRAGMTAREAAETLRVGMDFGRSSVSVDGKELPDATVTEVVYNGYPEFFSQRPPHSVITGLTS